MAQLSCYAPFTLCLPMLALPARSAGKQKQQALLPPDHDASQAARIVKSWAAMQGNKANEADSSTDEEACCSSRSSSADNSTESNFGDHSDLETQSTGRAVSSMGDSPGRHGEGDVVTREDALGEAFAGDRAEADVEKASSGICGRLVAPLEELMLDVEDTGAEILDHVWHEARAVKCHDIEEHVAVSQKLDHTKEDVSLEASSAEPSLAGDSSADDVPEGGFWARLAAPWQELLEDSAIALGVISETSNSGARGTGD